MIRMGVLGLGLEWGLGFGACLLSWVWLCRCFSLEWGGLGFGTYDVRDRHSERQGEGQGSLARSSFGVWGLGFRGLGV